MDNVTSNFLQTTFYPDNMTNETENSTGGAASFVRDEFWAKFEIAVLSLILYMALFGNTLVIGILMFRRRKLTRMQLFIIHLAIADIAVGLFQVMPQLINDITFRFEGNNFLCKVVKYGQVLTMYGSSYVLIMTALDRFMSICHPLTSQTWTSRRVHVMVLIAWALSALFAIPQLFIFSYKEHVPYGVYDCLDNFDFVNGLWKFQLYFTWIFFAIYAVPFVILTVCYSRICYIVWISVNARESTRGKRSWQLVKKNDSNGKENGTCSPKNIRNPRAHTKRLSKSKIKTVKLTLTVILCFLFCWAPWFVANIWAAYDANAPFNTNHFFTIATLLASLNSCTNPWIYLAFSGRVCTRSRRGVSKTWSSTANTCIEPENTRLRTFVSESAAAHARLTPERTALTTTEDI